MQQAVRRSRSFSRLCGGSAGGSSSISNNIISSNIRSGGSLRGIATAREQIGGSSSSTGLAWLYAAVTAAASALVTWWHVAKAFVL